jgi:hypothetical protein
VLASLVVTVLGLEPQDVPPIPNVIYSLIIIKIINATLLHRKESFSIFPSPAGMSLTKLLSLSGNYDVIYKLFLARDSLVSDIPAGDGNIEKLFLHCTDIVFFIPTCLTKYLGK